MFKENDRVVMLKSDGWVRKGQTGRVDSQNLRSYFLSIKILWDDGRTNRVRKIYLGITDEDINPNTAFALVKLNRTRRRP